MNFAVQELVRSRSESHHKKNLLDLAGQIQFAPDFDYKALREIRHAADVQMRPNPFVFNLES
ncbi:hypothetical protein [Nostoc sp. FACHB-280]|uniref:hypothetical protein n=1 Tax=Nostoc sp. FACHB-280 TaxID=2692839 RepID=UPI001F5511C8|nr:hypothetical protein [Nostoc sp. FACHB-280]